MTQSEITAEQVGPGRVGVSWIGPIPDGAGGTAGVDLRWGPPSGHWGAWQSGVVPASEPLKRVVDVTGLTIGPWVFQAVAFREDGGERLAGLGRFGKRADSHVAGKALDAE